MNPHDFEFATIHRDRSRDLIASPGRSRPVGARRRRTADRRRGPVGAMARGIGTILVVCGTALLRWAHAL